MEIISDFTVQRYLHDNIDLKESDKSIILGARNIKTHYNAYKGDVMFTYYNGSKIWNLCYNEIIGKWITRYSWTPFMSENIDHSMFSFDLLRTRIFGLLNTNLNRSARAEDAHVVYGSRIPGVITKNEDGKIPEIPLEVKLNGAYTGFNLDDYKVKGYYWDKNHQRIKSKYLYNYLEVIAKNITGDESLSKPIEKQLYESWAKYQEDKNPNHSIKFIPHDDYCLYYEIEIKYTPYSVAKVDAGENSDIDDQSVVVLGNDTKDYSIGLVKDYESLCQNSIYEDDYKNALISSIFVHGRSLNADEINYFDKNMANQCLPTKWYDSQEPFEFEVVVNEPKGLHKIFDNLMIISNNVEPESFEVEITGDVYGFNKEKIFKSDKVLHNIDIIPADKVKNNIDENGNVIDDRLTKQVNTRVH